MTIYEKILNKNVTNQITTYKNNVLERLVEEQSFLYDLISLLENHPNSQLLKRYINCSNQDKLKEIDVELDTQIEFIEKLTKEELLKMSEEEFDDVFAIVDKLRLRVEGI